MKSVKSFIIKLFGVLFGLLGVAILIVSVDLYNSPSEDINATVVKASEERYKITWKDREGETVEYNYSNKENHAEGDLVSIRVDSKTLKYRVPDQDGFTKCMVFGTLFVLAGLAIIFLIKPTKKNKANMFGQF